MKNIIPAHFCIVTLLFSVANSYGMHAPAGARIHNAIAFFQHTQLRQILHTNPAAVHQPHPVWLAKDGNGYPVHASGQTQWYRSRSSALRHLPLTHAASIDNQFAIISLLAKGAPVNEEFIINGIPHKYSPALIEAITQCNPWAIEKLFYAGAILDKGIYKGLLPAQLIALRARQLEELALRMDRMG